MYFIADVEFRRTIDGGRSARPDDGYRGSVRFAPRLQSSCEFFFESDVELGAISQAIIAPMFPEYVSKYISPGIRLEILEGNKVVGHMDIKEVMP